MTLPLLREVPPLEGRRVTVMGLGLFGGGLGVTRFLVKAGARVTVADQKTEHDLREAVAELRGLAVELRLGPHREEDFRDADLVIANPAVPHDSPWLRLAKALDTEMNLFFKLCRARTTIGITGSNGKTTTTTLVGEVLKRHPRRSWVGGNIGRSLLEHLEDIGPDDLVALELSSFQLEHLGAIGRSPSAGAVLNLTPNHLDRHGTMEAYAEAKRQIVAHDGCRTKILNWDDPLVRPFEDASPAQTFWFSLREQPPDGAWAHDERIDVAVPDEIARIEVGGRKIPGDFNLANMAAAAVATCPSAVGGWTTADWSAACRAVFTSFPGVEHRLEFVAEKGGVKYFNDSKATDPEAAIAALRTLEGPFVLILGGFDKKTPFDGLAAAVAEAPVRVCVLMGQTAPAIEAALRAQARVPEILRASSMEEAARTPARRGETVLLSPACASWDMYRNFTERGRAFKDVVLGMEDGR